MAEVSGDVAGRAGPAHGKRPPSGQPLGQWRQDAHGCDIGAHSQGNGAHTGSASQMICKIDGCSGAGPFKLGYCNRHYLRQYRYGAPTGGKDKMSYDTLPEQWFDNHYIEDASGCWLWTGHINKAGYGAFGKKHRIILAHRFSYERFRGKIPDGLFACHKCDVRRCVNPAHIFIGSGLENFDDMRRKGRDRVRGMDSGCRKLNDQLVRWVLEADLGNRATARALGLSHSTVNNIRSGKAWMHVSREGTRYA